MPIASASSPRLAVIIPIYKVEPYLRQCLDSVCGQTYPALKIILVDDGSPDACGAICDEYATRDPRITVIHQENKGLSEARNAGLRLLGDCPYFTFVDSDDWLELGIYERAMQAIEEDPDLDLVHFSYRYVWGDDSREVRTEDLVLSSTETICKQYIRSMDNPIATAVWNKVYRSSRFAQLTFLRDCRFGEDLLYTLQVLYRTRKMRLLPELGMNYREQRPGSLTALQMKKDLSHTFDCLEGIMAEHATDPVFVGYANALLVNQLWNYWSMLNTDPQRYREQVPRYIPYAQRASQRPLPNVFLQPRHYRKRRLFVRFPKVYMGIRAWLRRRHRKNKA